MASDQHLVTVHARKKAGQSRRSQKSIVLSIELVRTLFDRPLPEAAAAVGLGATAFKSACRQLGIERWPYIAGQTRPEAPNFRTAEAFAAKQAPETVQCEDLCSADTFFWSTTLPIQEDTAPRVEKNAAEDELAQFFESEFGSLSPATGERSERWSMKTEWFAVSRQAGMASSDP
eukprot:CAMPEP_0196721746 /NCGR_PEP_ID=MMETSP1091-20130531/4232_1 /TAXON_ID=302021 /ORGANISM="Rhodomonas sp., Strain CCMP768" /LENGTH=174 /DNA_ID=CAMNT_0042063285 /DNA_START=48 /DNA_END=572 /DNA_ORIENTATION=+